MDKILVQWTDGRSKGTTSYVKRSAIKEGTVAVGERVKAAWGKAKKTYNADVLSVGGIPPAPATPKGRATGVEEPFTFELAAAAPRASTPIPQPQPTPRADRQELEALADAVSGAEARLLCRLQDLEDKMTALQREVLEKCAPLAPPPPAPLAAPLPHPSPAPLPHPSPAPLSHPPPGTLPPAATSTPGPRPTEYQEQETPTAAPMASPALRDVSSRSNVVVTSAHGSYDIPPDVVSLVMFRCKSRRNLAARLAAKIFSVQERQDRIAVGSWGRRP